MISVRVSAVFQVRDGFTGKLMEGGALRCLLDGFPVRPTVKPGGYVVFANLPSGNHRITICCHGFHDELIDFTCTDGVIFTGYSSLKPSLEYFYRQPATHLHLSVMRGKQPAADEVLWLASPGAQECKIAQQAAKTGESELRLFYKGMASHLPIPGSFLIDDGKNSEITDISELKGEIGRLARPLSADHGRGKLLLPIQRYRTDMQGRLSAVFPSTGEALVYSEGRDIPERLELALEVNNLSIKW